MDFAQSDVAKLTVENNNNALEMPSRLNALSKRTSELIHSPSFAQIFGYLRFSSFAALSMIMAFGAGGSASAQDGLFSRDSWAITGTLGVAYSPEYQGSNQSDTSALVDLQAEYNEGQFFIGLGGIGYAPIRTDNIYLSFGVGYGGARDVSDDPVNLRGLGDVDGSVLFLTSASYNLGFVGIGADLRSGGDYGTTVDLSLGTDIPVSDQISISGGLNATWADRKHTQTYFGVTAAQAASSGKAAFTADSGFVSYGVSLAASYAFSDATSVTLGVEYEKLQLDAARSPISVQDDQTSVFLGVTQRF